MTGVGETRMLRNRSSMLRGPRLATGFVVAALFGQLGTVAHRAAVKHVECTEHGEQIEVADTDDTARATPAAEAAIHVGPALAHGHDHCPLATFRRERVQRGARVVLPARVARSVRAPAPRVGDNAPPHAIALLDLAPKSSPPTA